MGKYPRCSHLHPKGWCTDCASRRGSNRGNRRARQIVRRWLRMGQEP